MAASSSVFTGESQDSTDSYSFRSERVQSIVRNNYVISFTAKKTLLLIMYVCMCACMCVCMYVYVYICVRMYVCMYVFMYVCVCV